MRRIVQNIIAQRRGQNPRSPVLRALRDTPFWLKTANAFGALTGWARFFSRQNSVRSRRALCGFVLSFGLLVVAVDTHAGGMEDDPLRATFLADRLEWQVTEGDPAVWDVAAYAGYDLHKLYLYSEGSAQSDETESENELVYSYAVSPFWDIQGGVALEQAGSGHKTWGEVALQGLAPYFIDTRLRLKVSDEAVGAVFDFEYEALLTQKLILTPRFEADAYSDDVSELGIGSGLSSVTLGLRLRYEFIREFAPYVGVEYANTFGRTKTLYDGGEDTRFVAGVRFWF